MAACALAVPERCERGERMAAGTVPATVFAFSPTALLGKKEEKAAMKTKRFDCDEP